MITRCDDVSITNGELWTENEDASASPTDAPGRLLRSVASRDGRVPAPRRGAVRGPRVPYPRSLAIGLRSGTTRGAHRPAHVAGRFRAAGDGLHRPRGDSPLAPPEQDGE